MEDIINANQYIRFSSLSWANRRFNFAASYDIEQGHFTSNGQLRFDQW